MTLHWWYGPLGLFALSLVIPTAHANTDRLEKEGEMSESFHKSGLATPETSVLRSVQPQPAEQPFVYTVKDAHDAFEWLRRQQSNHAAIALAEWHRLATEVARLTEENRHLRAEVY